MIVATEAPIPKISINVVSGEINRDKKLSSFRKKVRMKMDTTRSGSTKMNILLVALVTEFITSL